MADEQTATEVLDDLLSTLESGSQKQVENGGGDAIDRVLSAPPRSTAVRSLRDAPEVLAFREALADGMIRADTVNRLLRLVDAIVTRLL
jgi:hypothetical protein